MDNNTDEDESGDDSGSDEDDDDARSDINEVRQLCHNHMCAPGLVLRSFTTQPAQLFNVCTLSRDTTCFRPLVVTTSSAGRPT